MLHAIRELTLSGVRAALQNVRRFRVRFDVVGAFPNERRARIVWAGVRKGEPAFVDLAETVRAAARQFATLDEKKAVLHVTLARLRDPMTLPRNDLEPSEMRVDEVVVFESLPDGKTTRYEVVERFSLTDHASSPERSR